MLSKCPGGEGEKSMLVTLNVCANKSFEDGFLGCKVLIKVTFLMVILQTRSTCYICSERGWKMPMTVCCKYPRHEKCEKKWRRTLINSSRACGRCRRVFEDPCNPVTEAWMNDKMASSRRLVSKDIYNDLKPSRFD